MTNFEKWKQELTLKEVSDFSDAYIPFKLCPAKEYCDVTSINCADTFKKWGEMEN